MSKFIPYMLDSVVDMTNGKPPTEKAIAGVDCHGNAIPETFIYDLKELLDTYCIKEITPLSLGSKIGYREDGNFGISELNIVLEENKGQESL